MVHFLSFLASIDNDVILVIFLQSYNGDSMSKMLVSPSESKSKSVVLEIPFHTMFDNLTTSSSVDFSL